MTPGVNLLFHPGEMFAWPNQNTRRLGSDRYPRPTIPNVPAPSFPFTAPERWTPELGSQAVDDQQFFFQPAIANPVRTSPHSRTKPSPSVKALAGTNQGLSVIRHCSSSVSRQMRYALAPGQVILNATERPEFQQPLAGGQAMQEAASSWSRVSGHAAIPSAEQQASALDEFREVCRRQYVQRAKSVNGEAAVSYEIRSQILEVVNVWMKLRYNIPASTQEPDEWLSPSFPAEDIDADLRNISFPFWGPAVPMDLKEGTTSKLIQQPSNLFSGMPDYVLHATLRDNPAIVEVKTSWALRQVNLETLLGTIGDVAGEFHNTGEAAQGVFKTPNWLLQQLWGEMHFFNVNLAILATNEFIVFIYRTGPRELTFSEFMSCQDPDVHIATMGFAMAAADYVLDVEEDEGGDDQRLADLIELLCPLADRRTPYHFDDSEPSSDSEPPSASDSPGANRDFYARYMLKFL